MRIAPLVILLVVLLVRPGGAAISPEQLAALRGDSARVERTLHEEQHTGRAELAQAFHQWQMTLHHFGSTLQETQDKQGGTLDRQLRILQTENTAQLEKMRATVDEKLQATLETRLREQEEVLSQASPYVRPGGVLVYITCSLLPEENENQVYAFIDDNPGFELLSAGEVWQELFGFDKPQPWSSDMKSITLTPASTGTDGFYFAVMQRKKD